MLYPVDPSLRPANNETPNRAATTTIQTLKDPALAIAEKFLLMGNKNAAINLLQRAISVTGSQEAKQKLHQLLSQKSSN